MKGVSSYEASAITSLIKVLPRVPMILLKSSLPEKVFALKAIFPLTCNLLEGELYAIPTLPVPPSIINLAADAKSAEDAILNLSPSELSIPVTHLLVPVNKNCNTASPAPSFSIVMPAPVLVVALSSNTCNLLAGPSIPIPTLPLLAILSFSDLLLICSVTKAISVLASPVSKNAILAIP